MLTPHVLGRLRAMDYQLRFVSSMTVHEVRSPGEPLEHMQRLHNDVRTRGIQQPVVMVYPDALIDGHHRAVLAFHFNLTCPAVVIHCDHDDPQGCAQVIDLCAQQHKVTQEQGWEWV